MITLYMIDTKGNIEINKLDVIERHIKYAKSFDQKCRFMGRQGKLVVLGRNVNGSSFVSENLDVINLTKSKRLMKYFWEVRTYLRLQDANSLSLIAGDPWHSSIVALLIKYSLKKRVRIETQLHFDFLNFFKPKGMILSRVLPKITLIILRRVDQIRVVDSSTLEFLRNAIKNNREIYFAPSLINIDSTFQSAENRTCSTIPRLLFVGRLHDERNPMAFVKFLRLLDSKGYAFEARIVGSGPLTSKLKLESSDLVTRGVLRFVGELYGCELFEVFCKSDVLISCARNESYGRAMREALYLGTRVLSFETTGSISLQNEVGARCISHVSPDVNADELISKINALLASDVDVETKQLLRDSQDTILRTLSDHWDNLVNTSV